VRSISSLRLLALVAGILVGASACGGVADTAPDVQPASACAGLVGSFYLDAVRPGRIDVHAMTPTLLSPRKECIPESCPSHLQDLPEGRTGGALARDYFCALGRLAFGHQAAAGELVNDVSRRLAAHWRDLQHIAVEGARSTHPLRVLITHYPRLAAPGRCVTLRATFYTVPDAYFDGRAGEDEGRRYPLPGALVRLSKTWQLEGGKPRIVEAWIEVAAGVDRMGPPPPFGKMLGVRGLAADTERDAHFDDLGGGRRWGLGWFDRAYGLAGEARPTLGTDAGEQLEAGRFWAGTWRRQDRVTETGRLPEAWAQALRTMMVRL